VTVRRDGEDVVIQASDDGVGIPPEALDRIFEPFFTTKSSEEEQSGGVGLGLAVVFGIVERHHGRIDVASTVGHGTTFTVRLPIRQPPEEAAVPEGSSP